MAHADTTPRDGRGGKREGAGRKPSPNPLQRVSIRIPAEHIARLRSIGTGNVSEGVRLVLAYYEALHPAEREG